MLLEREENIEIARRPAVEPGLPLTGQTDARALLDACGNVDRERALFLHMASAAALLAWMAHDAPLPAALGARALDGKEALARAHLAVACARCARLGLGSAFRARSAAPFAQHKRGHADLGGLAAIGVLERDLHVVAQIA